VVQSMAIVPTSQGGRYLQQLCSHWRDDFDVSCDAGQGRIALPLGMVDVAAGDMAMAVTCEPRDGADLDQMQDVVARHLNRFAFREGGLDIAWQRA